MSGSDSTNRILAVTAVAILLFSGYGLIMFDSDESDATDMSGSCGPSLNWSVDSEGNLTITGTGAMNNYESEDMRWGGNIIRTVSMPVGLTNIGNYAFNNCILLESITIPEGVTSIGDSAFALCISLSSVSIPNTVTSIDSGAFYACQSLRNLTMGNSVEIIGDYAFALCGITSLSIPDSVTNFGDGVLCETLSLTTITVGSNPLFCIEDGVLFNHDKSTLIRYPTGKVGSSYSIPNSVVTLAPYSFDGASLSTIIIPNSVVKIGELAFSNCPNLMTVELPNSVTTLGFAVFNNCSSLTTVFISESVTSIEGVSQLTPSLISIQVDESNPNFISSDGVLFTKDRKTLIKYPAGKTETSYEIPDTVNRIGHCAFLRCSSLTSITIPDSVTTIGDSAFQSTSLTSISIPDSVTGLSETALKDIATLASIEVGAGNTAYCIDNGALLNKSKTYLNVYPAADPRSTYTIPDSVTLIELDAFSYCKNLTSIEVEETNTRYSSQDGVLFVKDKALLIQYPLGNTRSSYTVPDSVKCIASGAFYGCANLKNIVVGETNTSYLAHDGLLYGYVSYWYTSSEPGYRIHSVMRTDEILTMSAALEKVTIPKETKVITDAPFNGDALKQIEFAKDSSVYLDTGTFYNCDSLETIVIPEGADITFGTSSIGFTDNREHTIEVIAPNGYKIPDCALLGKVKLIYNEPTPSPTPQPEPSPDPSSEDSKQKEFSLVYAGIASGAGVLALLAVGIIFLKRRA